MWYYLKKNRLAAAVTCIFIVLEWAVRAAAYMVMIQFLDAAIQLDLKGCALWLAVDLGTWGAYFLIGTIREVLQARIIRRMNHQIRRDMCLSILHKDYSAYRGHDSGEYLSWLTNNIKQIETLAWRPFFECVSQAAQVLCCGLALTTLHWTLPVFALVVAFMMWAVPKLFEGKMEYWGKECSRQQASAVSILKELISGRGIFLFFQREKLFEEREASASDQMETPNYCLKRLQAIANGLLGYLNVASQLVTYVLIVVLASKGLVKVAVFAGAGNFIGGVAGGLDYLAKNRLSLSAGKPYFAQITHDEETLATNGQARIPTMRKSLSVEDVSFCYGDVPVLKNISLCFQKGGKYALTGPSGSGKTTFLKLLMGEYQDYSGKISIDNRDIRETAPAELWRQMSYIEQDTFLFNATIRENITLGEAFSEEQLKKALKDSALENDLHSLQKGLETAVGENGCNLSGGQKQRVAIARALIHDRSILLVDEGTSALDNKNAEIIEESLLNNPDLTLILVSHHLPAKRRSQFTRVYDLPAVSNCSRPS